MQRRDFLRLVGAATIAPKAMAPAAAPTTTVLYNDSAAVLDRIGPSDVRAKDALWIRKIDLPRVNQFEVKPQGACRADVCIPIPKTMQRGAYFDLTAFARKIGQSVVVDRPSRVWSFGEIPLVTGQYLSSRAAPEFSVPDRKGQPVRLSQFRGRKVLVVTWASW